jgi:hypothetical protein
MALSSKELKTSATVCERGCGRVSDGLEDEDSTRRASDFRQPLAAVNLFLEGTDFLRRTFP